MARFRATMKVLTSERLVFPGEEYESESAPRGCINLDTGEIVGTGRKHTDDLAMVEVKPTQCRCVLFGDGPSLPDGIGWALAQTAPFDVICVNRAGLKWRGPMLAWVTRHADYFQEWVAARAALGFTEARHLVSDMLPEHPVGVLHARNSTCSGSGEFALEVAQRIGYARIVLAGFDLGPGLAYRVYAKKFAALKADTTRALHGGSTEIFSAPDPGWFQE